MALTAMSTLSDCLPVRRRACWTLAGNGGPHQVQAGRTGEWDMTDVPSIGDLLAVNVTEVSGFVRELVRPLFCRFWV